MPIIYHTNGNRVFTEPYPHHLQGFPGTGSLSRGAVNNASGARTPMGSLYTGVLVVVALLFMTPLFAFIPKATLAAIIIAAVIFMVEVKVVKPMWRSKSEYTHTHTNLRNNGHNI